MNFGLGLVLLAGIVSFLSPCVLSMVPIYLGVLGANVETGVRVLPSQGSVWLPGIFFILGFTSIFVTLGFTATAVGSLLYMLKPWIARLGGAVIILYGLHLMGWLDLPFLDFAWKPQRHMTFAGRYANAFFMGIFFSAGWSPCIGPILGAILTGLAASQATPGQGVIYLLVYSLGIGLPFLLAAVGLGPTVRKLTQKPLLLHRIQQISGMLLMIMGVLLMLGLISRLAQIAPHWLL